jgi:predicted SAM-dependent methyltransferase
MRLRRHVRRFIARIRKAINRQIGPRRFRRALARTGPRRIVIGSAGWFDRGWIPTDEHFLDLTKPATWLLHLPPNSVDALLAEHVWEHLTVEEARIACRTCFTYLKPGGYARIAVPDGYHPDPVYQGWVKVGGAWIGQLSNDHKVLYTYETLVSLFELEGFRVELLEYFDATGTFHTRPWDVAQGKIRRSERFYNRKYDVSDTSIIIDAFKPAHQIVGAAMTVEAGVIKPTVPA